MSDKLVPLATFWYPSEAHVVKSFLQSHDILSFVFDDNLGRVAWHLTGAIGGIRLMVMQKDYQKAVGLIEEANNLDVDLIGTHYNNPVKPTWFDNIMSFMISFISGVPTPWHRTKASHNDKEKAERQHSDET